MLTVQLYGRTGNQYLQAAACIGLANRLCVEYHIPDTTLNPSVWKPAIKHLTNPKYNPDFPTTFIREESHSYTDLASYYDSREGINVVLSGYFQSEKYFLHCLPEVRKAFGFDYTVKKPDVVCLHKRLGDYKMYPTKHCIITEEYIKQALGIMKEKGYSKCLVFSDEIFECEQTINSDVYPDWDFTYSHGRDELQDFQLMLECGSYIISASTYSLMAAILSESKNKVCVSPSKWNWFGKDNSNLSTETIIPENFIQIRC